MYQQSQPRGLASIIYGLGNALGVIAAVLLTPIFFRWGSNSFVMEYVISLWGHEASIIMFFVIGLSSAYIAFASVSLVFNFTVTFLVAAFAARRLSKRP